MTTHIRRGGVDHLSSHTFSPPPLPHHKPEARLRSWVTFSGSPYKYGTLKSSWGPTLFFLGDSGLVRLCMTSFVQFFFFSHVIRTGTRLGICNVVADTKHVSSDLKHAAFPILCWGSALQTCQSVLAHRLLMQSYRILQNLHQIFITSHEGLDANFQHQSSILMFSSCRITNPLRTSLAFACKSYDLL